MLIFIYIFITFCTSTLIKRVWIDDVSDARFDVNSLKEQKYKNNCYWVTSVIEIIPTDDSPQNSWHHSMVSIPYTDSGVRIIDNRCQSFITELYLEENKKVSSNGQTWETGKSGIRIKYRDNKELLSNRYTIIRKSPVYYANAYDTIEKVYNKSNYIYGFDNKFPPTVDSNDLIQEIDTNHPRAYRLGVNDCRTSAVELFSCFI